MKIFLLTAGYLVGLAAFLIGAIVAAGAVVVFAISAGGGGAQEVLRFAFGELVLPAIVVSFAGWVLKGFCRERIL